MKEAKGNDRNQEQLRLEEHLRVDNAEFKTYKSSQMDATNNPSGSTIHILMDFALKVIFIQF